MPSSRSTKLAEFQRRRHKPSNKPTPTRRKSKMNAGHPRHLDIRRPVTGDGYLPGQAEHLTALRESFSTRKNIAVISGAGISVNAGIPDFRNSSGRNCSRNLFDVSVNSTVEFHNMISNMRARTSNAKPTKYHHLLANLARTERLLYNFTQNIDCLEDKLSSLSAKTVQLHGRLDTLICQRRSIHIFQIAPEDFEARVMSQCPECETVDKERVQAGKRSHGVGVLLPKILLYGAGPDESVTRDVLKSGLFQKVDGVIIAGTRLQTRSVKRLAEELCRAAKWRNGLTVWINKERPTQGFESLLDYVLLGDCDEFASLIAA